MRYSLTRAEAGLGGRLPASTRCLAALGVCAVTLAGLLQAADPAGQWLPTCPYKAMTGFACVGCGLTRAAHVLLHGDVARAFAYNPWAFVAAPAMLVFGLAPAVVDPVRTLRLRTGISWMMLVITVVFWVWRNTDSYPFIRV